MLRTKLTLSTLVATIVLAGCSTQMTQPTQKDVSATKVEAVKAIPELDLGAKNGVSTTVNVNFSKTSSPFGIKSVFDGFQATSFLANVNSYVVVKMHKYTNAGNENPKGRFDGIASMDFDSDSSPDLVGQVALSSGLTGIKTFKLNGLMPNTKYYVSARAYTPGIDTTLKSDYKFDIDSLGVVTADPTSPNLNFSSVGIGLNDTLVIDAGSGPVAYRVVNTAPLTVVDYATGAVPAPVDGASSIAIYLERDVVSEGSLGGAALGDGQGSIGSVINGGGTAGGFGTGGDVEEFIQVNSTGSVSIMNDKTPAASGQNGIMDIQIQLKQDKKPQIPGEVKVNAGNPDLTSESISL
jgi:hypothetical protein